MKKILIAIALMFAGCAASAQIYKTEDGFQFKLGEYIFHGTCTNGYFTFYSDIQGYDEVDELAAFISRNIYELNSKYGIVIRDVQVMSSPIFNHSVMTHYSTLPYVVIGIATREYDEHVNKQSKEKEERLKSLKNIF